MSLTIPFRPLSPLFVATAAVAVTLGLAAPGMADQVRDNEWWLAEVNIMKAWQTTRGAGVTVAVLDTGVDASQPDLSGSVITGPDYTQSGRQLGTPYWGVHGTAMAALIAGHGHGPGQAEGVIGVAPMSKIISIRVSLEEVDPLRADTAVTSRIPTAIAAGIRYAVRHGAKVIDLPLDPGASYADGTPGVASAAGGSPAERNAVSYALAAGVVLVAPAGDDGPGPSQVNYPAAYRGVISVGSFDKSFTKSRFSTRRPYVTLTAPGEGIITAIPGAGYATVRSTSAASAIVAGLAALIRARYPGMTPWQVSRALTEGTRFRPVNGRSRGSGYGTADAVRALNAAAKIEAAAQPVTRAASPSPQAGRSTGSDPFAVIRDALIGGAGLLLLFSVIIAMQMSRRRKRGLLPARPARHTPPLAVRPIRPGMNGPQTVTPWETLTGEPLRPQLGPVPKLGSGQRTRPSEGPPWEPAPKPKTEPPWGLAESTPSGSISRGYVHPAPGTNGRSDAIWHAEPGSPGPPAPRDPSSRPAGAPPNPPAFPDAAGPAAGLLGPGPAAEFPGPGGAAEFPGPGGAAEFPGPGGGAEFPGPPSDAEFPATASDADFPDFREHAPAADFAVTTDSPDPNARQQATAPYDTDRPVVPGEQYGAPGHADPSWPYGHGPDSATERGAGGPDFPAHSSPGLYGLPGPLSALGWQSIAESRETLQPDENAAPQQRAEPPDIPAPRGSQCPNEPRDIAEPLGTAEPRAITEPRGTVEPYADIGGSYQPEDLPQFESAADLTSPVGTGWGDRPGNRPPAASPPAARSPADTADAGPDLLARREAQDIGPPAAREAARPANAWNPSAKTEDFPAVSGLHHGGEAGESWPPGSPFHPQRFTAPGDPRHEKLPYYPAAPAADTQAFPVIPLPEIGSYPDDDEDDRHL